MALIGMILDKNWIQNWQLILLCDVLLVALVVLIG